MGQARQRKAEIDQLKAQGPRRPMSKFMVRGTFDSQGKVSFDRTGLDQRQQAFVDGCERNLNDHGLADLQAKGITPTNDTALGYVMWNGPNDFAAAVMPGVKTTPDDAWNQLYATFAGGLALGRSLDRDEIVELGTEQAGWYFDRLQQGQTWLWPNAHAILEKRGDRLVVIQRVD